jgi:hypothetical protein
MDSQGPEHTPSDERGESLQEVRMVGFFVTALITAESIPAFVANITGGGPLMSAEDALAFFGFFLATFPVTSAVAVIVGMLISGVRIHLMAWFGIAAALLYCTTWLGNFLGLGALGIAPATLWAMYPETRTFVFGTLQLYSLLYGSWTFICTFVAGGFIGWAWYKMQPYM